MLIHNFLLLGSNNVGLVPLADIEVNIVGSVEIISHCVGLIIPISRLKCLKSLGQESLSTTSEVFLKPVGIHIHALILAEIVNLFRIHLATNVAIGIGLDEILNEVMPDLNDIIEKYYTRFEIKMGSRGSLVKSGEEELAPVELEESSIRLFVRGILNA